MQKINSEMDLRNTILQLEGKQAYERKELKEQFLQVYESVKPINLIKNTFKAVSESSDLKNNIVNTSVGLTAGYLSKKIFEKVSHNPLRKFLGSALMFGITNIISRNPEVVRSVGNSIWKAIFNKSGKKVNGAKKTSSAKLLLKSNEDFY